MPLAPNDWNVVVAGFWNRAILTPQGIAARLFNLEPDTPIEVEVPIDSLGPYRVRYDGLTVMASNVRLQVEPQRSEFGELRRAMDIARRAVDRLPETPLSAVGINVKYKAVEPTERLQSLIEHDWDTDLSDQQFTIRRRTIARSVGWNDGAINVSAIESDGKMEIQFNIERRSNEQAEHLAWLDTGIDQIEAVVRQLLMTTMRVAAEEIQ